MCPNLLMFGCIRKMILAAETAASKFGRSMTATSRLYCSRRRIQATETAASRFDSSRRRIPAAETALCSKIAEKSLSHLSGRF